MLMSVSESIDGRIRLALNDKSGSFSLYYMTDPSESKYEPFFNANDPSASFIAVQVDSKVYRLGESRNFKTSVSKVGTNPAFIFESAFLKITEVFSLIKTPNSMVANGVKITIDVENTGNKESSAALRILFDTTLGEGSNKAPFEISGESVTGEVIINDYTNKKYWISRDYKLSLMGSIEIPGREEGINPDSIHFANRKRLNDVKWKLTYKEGRSFNYSPFSTGDSAVCYYYEPRKLNPGESFQIVIYLSTEDKDGFIRTVPAVTTPEYTVKNDNEKYNNIYDQIITMRRYLETLDKFIAGDIILRDEDLSEIDSSLSDIKKRYNFN